MYFKLYKDKAGEFRWTLHAKNHEEIADSAEGYKSKASALHGIELVQGVNKETPVKDETAAE